MKEKKAGVVYFDQRTGALCIVQCRNHLFGNLTFYIVINKKKTEKVRKRQKHKNTIFYPGVNQRLGVYQFLEVAPRRW